MIGLFIHGFADSLIHRFIASLNQWFIGSLICCFIVPLFHWIVDSLVRWFTGSSICWIVDLSVYWSTDSLICWYLGSLCIQWAVHGFFFSLSSQQPSAIRWCTSQLQYFITSALQNLSFRPLISYNRFQFSKLPPRRVPGTIWIYLVFI
jgi:hypothetical protein